MNKPNKIRKHKSINSRQPLNDVNTLIRPITIPDTLLIELIGNERLIQLPVPQLEQRRGQMRVVNIRRQILDLRAQSLLTTPQLVTFDLQVVHLVKVARHSENTCHKWKVNTN